MEFGHQPRFRGRRRGPPRIGRCYRIGL